MAILVMFNVTPSGFISFRPQGAFFSTAITSASNNIQPRLLVLTANISNIKAQFFKGFPNIGHVLVGNARQDNSPTTMQPCYHILGEVQDDIAVDVGQDPLASNDGRCPRREGRDGQYAAVP